MKQIITLIFVITFSNILHAEVAKGVLEKYRKSNTLVCVGVYSCSNLAYALDADFTELYVIEEDQVMIDHAKIIFPRYTNPNNKNLKSCEFFHGNHDSFQQVMDRLRKPATIILGNYFPDADSSENNNIMHYLDIIQQHRTKTHVIIVDHINHAGTPRFGNISLETIMAKVLEINPYYKLYFERGGFLGNEDHAILVAYTQH